MSDNGGEKAPEVLGSRRTTPLKILAWLGLGTTIVAFLAWLYGVEPKTMYEFLFGELWHALLSVLIIGVLLEVVLRVC